MSRGLPGFDGPTALVPGELRGYRRFRLAPDGLHPTVHAAIGAWRDPERAVCAAGSAHAPPAPGCGCGLYGWYHPGDARADSGSGDVSAVIAASGRVSLGEHGFRAASARIEAVALVGPRRGRRRAEQMLARRYPRTRVYRSRRRMLRSHPPDHLGALGIRSGPSPASRYRATALTVWVTGVLALYSVVVLPHGSPPGPAIWGAALVGFLAWQAVLVWLVTRCFPPELPRPASRPVAPHRP